MFCKGAWAIISGMGNGPLWVGMAWSNWVVDWVWMWLKWVFHWVGLGTCGVGIWADVGSCAMEEDAGTVVAKVVPSPLEEGCVMLGSVMALCLEEGRW